MYRWQRRWHRQMLGCQEANGCRVAEEAKAPFQTYVVHSRAGRDGVSVHLNRMGRTCGHYASALMHHPTTG